MTQSVPQNLTFVRQRIAAACAAAGRKPQSVRLVAVSKTYGPALLQAARAAGQHEFGESYVKEAVPKIAALERNGTVWHFIGPIQSNKTREIARHFDWVQSIDREKAARRLSEQRPPELPPLQVCVQVNISGEHSKSGVAPGKALELCRIVNALPRLTLRGLMAIPAPLPERADARAPFRELQKLYMAIRGRIGEAQFDTLSAGMSDDLEHAIAEGSTLVRIGTAIFGTRDRQP